MKLPKLTCSLDLTKSILGRDWDESCTIDPELCMTGDETSKENSNFILCFAALMTKNMDELKSLLQEIGIIYDAYAN